LITNLRRKLAVGLGLGFAVFIGLVLYGDIQEISALLKTFRWELIPAILGLTLINYFLRGLRFHYYLYQIGVKNISLWTSLRVFIGGFSLTITPGKIGELIRVFWLKNLVGADPVHTAPSTVVDRIADGLAMAILAALAALVYPQYRVAVLLILGVILGGVIISQVRPLAIWSLNVGEKLPFISRFIHHLRTLYETTYELLRFKNLVIGVGIGLISWSAEGVAFYLVLIGLGLPPAFNLVLLANFTLALGSILGGVSSLPGGLGAAEATMTGMLQALIGLPGNVAATATLLIRFFTLWFGVSLGIVTVLIWRRILFGIGTDTLILETAADRTDNKEPVKGELGYDKRSEPA
jgi:uncharacterized protein (TIRG00374 family)